MPPHGMAVTGTDCTHMPGTHISEGTVVASFGAVRALRKGEVGTRTRLGYSFMVRETGGRTLEITPRQGTSGKNM